MINLHNQFDIESEIFKGNAKLKWRDEHEKKCTAFLMIWISWLLKSVEITSDSLKFSSLEHTEIPQDIKMIIWVDSCIFSSAFMSCKIEECFQVAFFSFYFHTMLRYPKQIHASLATYKLTEYEAQQNFESIVKIQIWSSYVGKPDLVRGY